VLGRQVGMVGGLFRRLHTIDMGMCSSFARVFDHQKEEKSFFLLFYLYITFFYGMAVVYSILRFAESFTMCFYFIILLFFLRVPFFFRLMCASLGLLSVFGTVYIICALGLIGIGCD
jgi:hypothetical protein